MFGFLPFFDIALG